MKDANRSGKGRLIAFAGSTPNIGTTLLGFGTACLLSRSAPALSVGYVCLHVLFGNMLREQADFYMPDDIEHMLDAARRTFDICFVDVSAYWDNAATIGAMREGDVRVIVTTPELTQTKGCRCKVTIVNFNKAL